MTTADLATNSAQFINATERFSPVPRAPCPRCRGRSGRCQSRRTERTCSRRPCAPGPASRSGGRPCWDRTWLRQSACSRRLGLPQVSAAGAGKSCENELNKPHKIPTSRAFMGLQDVFPIAGACSSWMCVASCLQASRHPGTPPRRSARHPRCSHHALRRQYRSLRRLHSSPWLSVTCEHAVDTCWGTAGRATLPGCPGNCGAGRQEEGK